MFLLPDIYQQCNSPRWHVYKIQEKFRIHRKAQISKAGKYATHLLKYSIVSKHYTMATSPTIFFHANCSTVCFWQVLGHSGLKLYSCCVELVNQEEFFRGMYSTHCLLPFDYFVPMWLWIFSLKQNDNNKIGSPI